MADEKKTVKETQENGKMAKFVAFFKNLPQNIATPFKNMWHELKKVTWPTKPDLIKYTGIVIVFMVFMGVVIGLLDMGSSRLVTAVSSLKGTEEQIIIEDSTEPTADESTEGAAGETAEAAQQAAEQAAETAQEAVNEAAETVQNETEQPSEAPAEEAPATGN